MHLVERSKELATLQSLFNDCLQNKSKVAIISGGFATGKTALLHGFAEKAVESGAIFLRANASRVEKELSFGVLEQLLRSPELPPESAQRAARWLDGNASRSLPCISEAGMNAAEGLASAFRELWEILRDLTEHRPVVVGINDIHFADETSLRILLYLLRRLRSARLLTVLTDCLGSQAAPSPLHNEVFREPNSRQITLAPLTERGVRALLAGHVEPRTAPRLASDIHRASAGHPPLVRALIEDILVGRTPDVPGLVAGEAFSRAMLGFLHRHESPVLDVARAIAILGRPRSLTFLGRLLHIDPTSAEHAVNTLAAAGILTDTRFRHSAVQTAVVTHMSTDESRTLHDRAAALLRDEGAPATEVAAHIIASNNNDAPWVIPVLQDAAGHALAADEPTRAIRYLKTAYQMCDDDRRPAIAARLADAEWRIDPGRVLRHLPEFHAAVQDDRLDAQESCTPVTALLWHGRMPEAVDALEAVKRNRDAAKSGPRTSVNPNSPQLWLSYLYPELFTEGPAEDSGILSDASQLSAIMPQNDEAATLVAELLNRKDGDPVAAEAVLARTRLGPQTFAHLSIALATLIYNDRLDEAADHCGALLDQAVARRSPTWQALFTAQCAMIHYRRGQLLAAERKAEAALSLISLKSWGIAVGLPISCSVLAKTATGKVGHATDRLALSVPEEMLRTSVGLHYLYARGRHHLAVGRYHAALDDFRECDRGIDLPTIEPWRAGAAEALLRLGDPRGARRLADEQLALSKPGHTRTRGIALRVRAAAIQDPRERPAPLNEAVRHLRLSGDRLELSYALADLGDTYHELGEHERARDPAHESSVIARQCRGRTANETAVNGRGAARLAGLIHDRPHAPAPAKLSKGERRVAVLAAEGYTNLEISRRLYITVSTVEQHLTKIYRKLNVRRFDLKAALDRIGVEAGVPGGRMSRMM